ncbi:MULTISPECIES: ABC transporter ATP-binding protein [Rhizobium]|uniref:dipeptide ABC transporter ATP-binding protein n=1 Tax=Rhizobium TaxID=379 RepID=UPI00195D359E|nr:MULTISPECIES: ABC transporter ATP-binding protein [Rhizobium]MBM7043969.1 ABC transporter ATP-binding protein [Rhizobium lusitanum]
MNAPSQEPIVELKDLNVSYRSGNEIVTAVREADLTIARGEIVAIVGESGSGKSTLANTLIGLLANNARVEAASIRIDGEDVSGAGESLWRTLRGRVVGLIPQDPTVSLNPTMRIGRQIGEAVERARGPQGRRLDAEVVELLEQVGIDRPLLRARQYPHELSGGMRQRVLIAIAMAGRPKLIIADEPTSALDVTVQRRILDHLEQLVKSRGISMLIITHDLGVAAERADRILVMQAGRIVEQGRPAEILNQPVERYTRTLVAAAPAFKKVPTAKSSIAAPPASEILRFEAVSKVFDLPGETSWFGRRSRQPFQALDQVSFSVHAGQTLAIVGESGSGKTTSLRIALGLERPTSGHVLFEGQDVTRLSWNEFRPLRQRIQLVQQNPFASLDPRYTVFESIVEPLQSFGIRQSTQLQARARQLADQVRLPRLALNRLPRELSGGQRQRVAIARALALGPELLFLDEPVSALDVSIQAQILDLLGELQRELGVSYVLVSHDLSVVSAIAHHIVVLRSGQVVEQGPADKVFGAPEAAYTRELIEAIPGRRLA